MGGRVEPVLAAHIRAGGDRFRGIRHITAWDADASVRNPAYSPPPGLLGDKTFREGFAVLGRLGLSFDAWLYHPQIDELTDLARGFPETTIVLNHVGGPIGIGAYAGKPDECSRAGRHRSRRSPPAQRLRQARRPRHAPGRLRLPRAVRAAVF